MWPFREARAGAVTRDATEVAISALAARAAGKDARPETLRGARDRRELRGARVRLGGSWPVPRRRGF